MGQDMSVALITTFYGSVLSNLIFHPIAKKLRIRQDEEELYCSTIIEGIIAIQSGENPKYLRSIFWLHQAVPAEKASVKGRSRQRQGRRCRQ